MIKQIGLPLCGGPIYLITRMITDQIGLHSVLLPLLIIIIITIIIIFRRTLKKPSFREIIAKHYCTTSPSFPLFTIYLMTYNEIGKG